MKRLIILILFCLPILNFAGKPDLKLLIEKNIWDRDKILQDYI